MRVPSTLRSNAETAEQQNVLRRRQKPWRTQSSRHAARLPSQAHIALRAPTLAPHAARRAGLQVEQKAAKVSSDLQKQERVEEAKLVQKEQAAAKANAEARAKAEKEAAAAKKAADAEAAAKKAADDAAAKAAADAKKARAAAETAAAEANKAEAKKEADAKKAAADAAAKAAAESKKAEAAAAKAAADAKKAAQNTKDTSKAVAAEEPAGSAATVRRLLPMPACTATCTLDISCRAQVLQPPQLCPMMLRNLGLPDTCSALVQAAADAKVAADKAAVDDFMKQLAAARAG